MNCYGIDGCPGGWIALGAAVESPLGGADLETIVESTFEGLIAKIQAQSPGQSTDCNFNISIDMPIGLPDRSGFRPCDRLARTQLGPRRSSIFPVPSRIDLQATEFSQLKGSGLSIQAFNLFKKIRQLDSWINPARQLYCRETHPELVFQRLNQGIPLLSKSTSVGRDQRNQLISGFIPKIAVLPPLKGCKHNDLLDAAALLISVHQRLNCLQTLCLDSCQVDQRTLRMEICY
jgi:predicted RNase H-like nuclease